jgi:arylsulfatase A-like enzyme
MRQVARIVLGLGLVLTLAAPLPAIEARPNVVLIFADDLGWGDVGFNGRTEWTTPHLDRLARQGTILNRFYAAAVTCAPSRATMLTGKYTIHCGVSRNDDELPGGEVTIAEAMKKAGYATALFGKWHHGKPIPPATDYTHPMDQGFDEFFGFTDAVHAWEKFPEELWDGRERKPVTGYADDLFVDHSIDFIKRHRNEPFFLYVPLISAHFHIEAPGDEIAKHLGKFPEADPKLPLNATYAAQVTRMDAEIGRLTAALDELNLREKTLVIFTSDHGATFEGGNQGTSNFHDSNRPFRGQKRTLWEGGIRVPAVVSWPGTIPEGVTLNELIGTIDLLPTILAAAGTTPEPSWHVDGIDVLPYLTGKSAVDGKHALPERTMFWEWRSEGTNQTAAMRGAFKLVVIGTQRPELFKVDDDPAERRNVAALHPELYKELRAELKAWLDTETTR